MKTLNVVNIKCGGCQHRIVEKLQDAGFSNVSVDADAQTVTFAGDADLAGRILQKIGYPKAGSKAAASLTRKAKSYISCLIGKSKN